MPNDSSLLGEVNQTPPGKNRAFDRERLFVIFFFAAYFFLLYQLSKVLAPFLAPLLSAAMLALVAFPMRQKLSRWVISPTANAAIVTLLVTVTVVVPVFLLIWLVTREATAALPAISAWIAVQQATGWPFVDHSMPAAIDGLWSAARTFFGRIELDLAAVAQEGVREIGNRVTVLGASMVREFFALTFALIILLFALFFFLRDGPRLVSGLLDLVPMQPDSKRLVLDSLNRTLVAMVRGTVITASAQGALTGVGLAMFGVPFPVLLGFVATFMSVVPFVGAALVWAPAALYLMLSGETVMALGLVAWGMIVVGLIDNLLRPIVVGTHAQLPATLLFLGVLGGFQVYGLVGGLISPLLIACVWAFARIYRQRYAPAPPI
jgi:predicted PurR-regulated permease PerM